MNVAKAYWHSDGDNVRVTMPLQKVDTENRIVSGWATMDSVDTSDDVILASASKAAFENFRGNIRLMHQPIPAGKLVDFREDSYYDPETQKFYQGIYVDVYVSKGAEDIWEMVKDGTLTGFSIGGRVTDHETQFVKDAGKAVRFIKAYDLIELSLVDSPANQLCDIISITKSADGTTSATGMVTEVVAENVFWCGSDKIAFTSQDEAKACTACGGATENIGWFESDGGSKTEKVNAIVAGFVKSDTVEGRLNNMAEETQEVTPETVLAADGDAEVTGTNPTPEDAPAAPEVTPVADEADEAPADEEVTEEEVVESADKLVDEIEAVIEEIDADIKEIEEEAVETPEADEAPAVEEADAPVDVEKLFAEFADAIEERLTKVLDALATFDGIATKVDELGTAQAELAQKFSAVSDTVDGVKKSYAAVEKSVGIKKSGDLGGSPVDEVVEKSATKSGLWNGRFFGSVGNI